MLDRQAVQEFLEDNLKDWGITLESDIDIKELTEAFCVYVEDDYYEWLNDNVDSFFEVGTDGIDWDLIKERIEKIK